MYLSQLSQIFKPQEIEIALDEARDRLKKKESEEIYNPRDRILSHGQQFNEILYVARGLLIEKDGDYMDNKVGSLRLPHSNIACLQNLIADSHDNFQISDVYCHHSSMASVIKLDLLYLKDILQNSLEKQ